MALSQEMQVAVHRLVLFGLGGIAALALWVLGENWDYPGLTPALYLALFTFTAAYSTVVLALAGPVPTPRALAGALVIAGPVTALVSLAGLRFVQSSDLLDEPVMLSVIAVLVFVSTPFLLVWVQRPSDWRRYSALFDAAWTMMVRYVVALIFVGVFWLVAFLSNALLGLVDIDVIDAILRTDWAVFGLSGAVFGLGLAVVYELRNRISPYLILRLLRLLVPVVLLVVAVFLAAVPFRGLSELFGELSAATTLLGVAIAAITLISAALDREDDTAVSTRGIRMATRALTLILPLLAALAVWAVVLRVRQYGWTPDRVLAAAAALFVLAYGVGYCVSALRWSDWATRVRRANVAMALAIIAVSALWMTPVLNPYRISMRSQVTRFEAGQATLDQLPVWQLQHHWGRAGQDGLARLEAMTERADHTELLARIDAARTHPSAFRYRQEIENRQAPGNAENLARLMAVRPAGPALTPQDFAGLPFRRMTDWLNGCQQSLPDGRAGCVLVRGTYSQAFDADTQGIVLFLDSAGQARANFVMLRDGKDIKVKGVFDPVADRWPSLPASVVAQALDGVFEIRPSGTNALFIGDMALVPGN